MRHLSPSLSRRRRRQHQRAFPISEGPARLRIAGGRPVSTVLTLPFERGALHKRKRDRRAKKGRVPRRIAWEEPFVKHSVSVSVPLRAARHRAKDKSPGERLDRFVNDSRVLKKNGET